MWTVGDEQRIVRIPTGRTIEAPSGAYVHVAYESFALSPDSLPDVATDITVEHARAYLRNIAELRQQHPELWEGNWIVEPSVDSSSRDDGREGDG